MIKAAANGIGYRGVLEKMSKPSERVFTGYNDIFSSSDKILIAESRIVPEKDERTVKDDFLDYVYLNPIRRKHHSKKSSHHKHHKKKKSNKWKKVLIACLCVFLMMFGVFAMLLSKGYNEFFDSDIGIFAPESMGVFVANGGKDIVYNGKSYKYNENICNMLFIGVDKNYKEDHGKYGMGGRADIIVLMALDVNNRKLTVINIPGYTMTNVSKYSMSGRYTGIGRLPICLSHSYCDGKKTSCVNTVASVKHLFYNIPINTYYAMNLDGIDALNDAVGGIDVDSPETIEKFVRGDSYHLTGEDSERFVRAGDNNSPDAFDQKTQRQQIYTKQFMTKYINEVKGNLISDAALYNATVPYSCTNLDVSKLIYLEKEVALGGTFSTEFLTVPGKTSINSNDHIEYNVDEKVLYEQVLSVFYDEI